MVKNIVIGIPVRQQPERVAQTLESLRTTAPSARIVLIPDNPDSPDHADDATAQSLASLTGVQVLAPPESHGNAGCFNRLIGSGPADVYILLESGAVATPGWLERLLATFSRIPRCGLTGPSTNHSWNEQGVLRAAADGESSPATAARSVERRFGTACRSLNPLHSLSDFCYAVRREVVDAIGLADEGYAAGPCWEMDYNIRAFRAGFLGVWTCGAYVHRAAAPPEPDASLLLEQSKQRYQDKFCGLRLRGLKSDYRPHCRGDACTNFAPPTLIALTILPGAANPAPALASIVRQPAAAAAAEDAPLVSCIMPTCDRRAFVPAAIAHFLAQDYARLELIVVDDGADPIDDLLPDDPRIRYFRLEQKQNTGAKRNYACEQARGRLIAHWDDDDWHAPNRIRRQVQAMLAGNWQVGGTTTLYYRNSEPPQAHRYAYLGPGHAWMGAMIYTREAWERIRFDAIQVGEDVRFIARVPVAQRLDMHDLSLTVCTIHASNTCPKVTAGPYWTPVPVERVDAVMSAAPASDAAMPLISCIMPTHNRRAFLSLALDSFLAQTYPNRELVVIDDGADAVGDVLQDVPGVRYVRMAKRATIGAKRNMACEAARGELIAHWDDDDWYGPGRLAYQAESLNRGQCDLNGLVSSHVLEMPAALFWTISRELHRRMFVGDIHGGTLMFRKELWLQGVRYPEVNLAEDAALVRQCTQRKKRLLRLDDAGVFLYLRHGRNTWKFDSGRFVDPAGWRKAAAPEGFAPEVLERYRTACLQAAQA